MAEGLTIHVRLYNANQQHLAAQVARLLSLAGYSVSDVKFEESSRDFSGVELQPGAGPVAAEAMSKIVTALKQGGVALVRSLQPDQNLPENAVQVGVCNV